MLKLQYFLLVSLLFSLIFSNTVPGNIEKKEELHTKFINSFNDKYIITSKMKEGKLLSKASLRLEPAGLRSIKTYRLKAKDQIKGKKGFYLQFRLSVYVYNDSGQSKLAFSKYKKKELEVKDYMRSKSPMISLLKGNYVYIIDGSCLFSRKNMDWVEQKLVDVLFQNGLPGSDFFLKRVCGGSIVEFLE